MRIEITSQPRFELPLSLETVDLLMEMSRHHYDGLCKSASGVGGFIYGWRNSVEFSPELPVTATSREIDTVLKICEIATALFGRDSIRSTAVLRLTSDLRIAMRKWNGISDQWVLFVDTDLEQRKC